MFSSCFHYHQILAYFHSEQSSLFDTYLRQARTKDEASFSWHWDEFLEAIGKVVERIKRLVDEQQCLFNDLKEAADIMEGSRNGRRKEMDAVQRCPFIFAPGVGEVG